MILPSLPLGLMRRPLPLPELRLPLECPLPLLPRDSMTSAYSCSVMLEMASVIARPVYLLLRGPDLRTPRGRLREREDRRCERDLLRRRLPW